MVKDSGTSDRRSTASLDRATGFGSSSTAFGSALSGQRNTLGHLAALPDTQNPYNKFANGDGDKDSIDDGIHMGIITPLLILYNVLVCVLRFTPKCA